MAKNAFTCFSILLLTMSIQTESNQAIQIEISPATYDTMVHDEVNITCTLDGDDIVVQKVLVLGILKKSKPIVLKHPGLKPSFPNGNQSRFVATGHINKNVKKSYLSMTLERYESSDAALYSCVIYFLDKIGQFKMDESSMHLTEERLNLTALEKAMTFMKNKMVKMENDLKEKTNILEGKTKTQSQLISTLTKKVSYTTSFAATSKLTIYPKRGQVIVLSDIIHQNGTDFNPTTGIFTASISGLYSFHMSVMVIHDKSVYIDIQRNDQTLVRLRSYDKKYSQQSDVTGTTPLTIGDTVKPYASYMSRGVRLYGHGWTIFSGFLVRPY